jgi:hypothetical protein
LQKNPMQQLARCSVQLAPLRVLPDHKSEQYSQLLIGDWVICGQQIGQWVEVSLCWNGDTGWVLYGQLELLVDGISPIWGLNALHSEHVVGLFQTSVSMPNMMLIDNFWHKRYLQACQELLVQAMPFVVNHDASSITLKMHVALCEHALMGAPYVWGGMSFLGIDCSGLVQLLYRYRGIPLPHSASKQIQMGRVLDFIQEAQAGDLAFFADEDGHVVHVGIMLSPTRILHASASSGRVQVDNIDWQGIINAHGNRTHSLRVIKRIEE